MVYVLGIAAAAFLGVGWVLQQRVAVRSPATQRLNWAALRVLIRSGEWWGGIAAMSVGQSLAAWALQNGPITIVEPLLVSCLFFAFGLSAWLGHHPIRLHEVVGTALLAGAVAMFLAVANPQANVVQNPGWGTVLLATGGACVVAAVVVLAGRWVGRARTGVATATSTAAAAGIFYALQDVATRGAIVAVQGNSVFSLLAMTWPYVLLFAAVAGVLLSQEAFRAARLDWSLPPTAAVQPLAGVALGVGILDDHLASSTGGLAVEALSIVLGVAGVVVMGRSLRAMRRSWEPQDKAMVASGKDGVSP